MPAVSLTDHGSMAGAIDLYKAAARAGRQADLRLRGVRRRRPARADEGARAPDAARRRQPPATRNLIKLCSLGYLEGYYYKPRVDWELLERHAPGLIALSGCLSGRVSRALSEHRDGRRRGRARPARADLRARQRPTSSCRTSALDVQQPAFRGAARARRQARSCRSSRRATSTTSTRPTRTRHEALLCIQSGDSLKNPNHWRFGDERVLLQDARGDGARLPGARGRDAPQPRGRRALQRRARARPDPAAEVPVPGRPRRVRLPRRAVREGARASATAASTPELDERLRFELKTIREMGFADYFLIVADFIGFAKRERRLGRPGPRLAPPARSPRTASRSPTSTRCATGSSSSGSSTRPARTCPTWTSTSRSRAGSASSTTSPRSTGATASRRSSPSRRWQRAPRCATPVACSRSRTASSTGSRSSIPEGPGQTLEEALKPGSELAKAVEDDPVAKEIVDLARPLEGLTRADSIHAAGVVIGAAAADRRRAAPAEGRRRRGRDAALDEERRGARPAEGRLPRPAQPRRDRQGGRADRRRPRHRHDPARRPEDVRDARAGRRDGRLPVRVVGDARRAAAGEADASSRT